MIYFYATILLIANLLAWSATIFMAPGNWIMVALAATYAWFLPETETPHLSWTIVGISFILAIVGEIVEFSAGAAGAAKQGGSKRGAIFSIVGTIVGSIAGAILGLPIPVMGSAIAGIAGGAIGAFVGAYLGEQDRFHGERIAIGKGAMIGRLIGTVGKMVVGAIILFLITLDSFVDF